MEEIIQDLAGYEFAGYESLDFILSTTGCHWKVLSKGMI